MALMRGETGKVFLWINAGLIIRAAVTIEITTLFRENNG